MKVKIITEVFCKDIEAKINAFSEEHDIITIDIKYNAESEYTTGHFDAFITYEEKKQQ